MIFSVKILFRSVLHSVIQWLSKVDCLADGCVLFITVVVRDGFFVGRDDCELFVWSTDSNHYYLSFF